MQWHAHVHPSYAGRKIVIQIGFGIKQDTISKITNAKRAGRMTRHGSIHL
jgi:hypothetical protein